MTPKTKKISSLIMLLVAFAIGGVAVNKYIELGQEPDPGVFGDTVSGVSPFKFLGNAIVQRNLNNDLLLGGTASASSPFVFDPELELATFDNLTITGTCTGCSGGSGTAGVAMREGFSGSFASIASVSFNAPHFNLNTVGTHASLSLDWTNGPASRSMANAWTAHNTFTTASLSGAFEIGSYASISGPLYLPTAGVINFNASDVTLTHSSNTLTLAGGVFAVPAGTQGAPTFTFSGATTTGMYSAGGSTLAVTIGGAAKLGFQSTMMQLVSDETLGWVSAADPFGTADLILRRQSAGVLAQRNGTNAQAMRIYRTYDGTNDAYLSLGFSSNDILVRPVVTGSATGGRFIFESTASQPIRFAPAGTSRWDFDANGHLSAVTDNSVDIGAASDNRPRTGYFATSVVAPLFTGTSTTASHSFGGTIEGTTDGTLSLGTVLKKLKAVWSNIIVAVNQLFIPTGTPTISLEGQIGGKTASASSGAYLRVHDGTAQRVVKDQSCFTYAYEDPTATNHWGRKKFNDPFTLDSVAVIASGSNAVGWNLSHGPSGSITTDVFTANKSASSSATYTTFADGTLNDGDFMLFKITSASATIENIDVTVCGRYAP